MPTDFVSNERRQQTAFGIRLKKTPFVSFWVAVRETMRRMRAAHARQILWVESWYRLSPVIKMESASLRYILERGASMRRILPFVFAALVCAIFSEPSDAVIKADTPLSSIVRDSSFIVVGKVE